MRAYIYPVSVVSDLQQLQTTFFNNDLEKGGPRINGILYELFQSMHRCHNNLTSGNLIHNIGIKGLFRSIRKNVYTERSSERTLILLGAVTMERSSSAFRLVPLGTSRSTSIGSDISATLPSHSEEHLKRERLWEPMNLRQGAGPAGIDPDSDYR